MKTKICVFNDRKIPMNLNIQDIGLHGAHGYMQIPEGRMSVVEIEIPDGTIPYLKVWETGQALLSYVDADTVA